MADKPILFSAPMVRALLSGTKTQTRRAVTPHIDIGRGDKIEGTFNLRIAVGDRLYVREAWRATRHIDDKSPRDMVKTEAVQFIADGTVERAFPQFEAGKHRQAMHMPKWASRLTLTVTDVRVQRLQDINRGDAMEEGCPFANMAKGPNPRDWYAVLWDSINGPGAWDANPWVAAHSFTVQHGNIDQVQP